MPNVAIKGGILNRAISAPLTQPVSAPISSATSTGTPIGTLSPAYLRVADSGSCARLVANTAANSGDEGLHFGVLEHLVEAGALDIQDLAADGQDRLGARIAGIERGDATTKDLDLLLEIAGSMGLSPGTTICGLADGNNWAIRTIVNKFRGEFEARVKPYSVAVSGISLTVTR